MGNKNLEWMGFRCCKLLNNKSRGYWANSMKGLHFLCGFKTNSYKRNNFGKRWAEQMSQRKKIYQAWFKALDLTNQNGVVARVLAEARNNFYDRLHGYGYVSPDPPVDKYYYYKDHKSGSPPYLPVYHLDQMQVYEVIPRDVNESYIRDIGNHFGFSASDAVEYHNDYLLMSRQDPPGDPCDPNLAVHTLQVYTNSGQYSYFNTGPMWPSQTGLTFPDPTTAYGQAEAFLTNSGLHMSDAGLYDVEYDTLCYAEGNDVNALTTDYIGCAVTYAREIEAFTGTNVSVAGAGARLKVYLNQTGGDPNLPAAMGNWRNITSTGIVPVLPKQEVFDRFKEHGEKVSLEPISVEYNRVVSDLNTPKLAYYEHPGAELQAELIPIWIFSVDYYDGDELLTTADTFVPSAHEFYPPIANITSPGDGSEFEPNDVIDFNSVTDSNYGTSPYTYEWTSDIDGQLSTAASFSGSLNIACVSDDNSIEVASHTIMLTITDADGRSSSESVDVTIRRFCSDLNCDNIVNFGDLAVMGEQWLKP
ncbi:MAG: hypothetical protein KKE31_05260 [Planctomycetes bacterium]|nr:hypothetical protein [Planctomycetota bacterium]MBU1517877.1 hypothetical protein [Planctomycetota bacterium]MBU2458013.1 hypothetical protein [Planctomycetota bacterium]